MAIPGKKLSDIQRRARLDFRRTRLAKLLTEANLSVRRGTATISTLARQGKELKRLTGPRIAGELFGLMGMKSEWDLIEKYAGPQAWKRIVSNLGSVGRIIASLSKPGKKYGPAVGLERELEAAANLLTAFGFKIIPPGVATAAPQHQMAQLDAAIQQEIIRQEAEKAGMPNIPAKPHGLPGWPRQGRKAPETPESEITQPGGSQGPLLPQMQMIEVSSSNVHSIGFLYETAAKGTLYVRYLADNGNGDRSGPGSLYEYYDVPARLWDQFQTAGSKGKFVWDKLRIRGTVSGHRFNYDLAGITRGYVPRRAQLTYREIPGGRNRQGKRKTPKLIAQEYFVKRSFNLGEVRGGRLQMRRITSQLPDAPAGSFYMRGPRRGK